MAHFGVQKAKKMLALVGATAIAGAGLASGGNASAISELSGSDYACSIDGNNGSYAILLKTTDAIKWAIKDQEKFYEPGPDTCYVDWSPSLNQHEINPNNLKFYIAGGSYEFDEFVSRDADSEHSYIYIGGIPDVFETGEHTHVEDADVTFSATSANNGFDSSEIADIIIHVAENSSLVINSGKYTSYFDIVGGDLTINNGTFVDTTLFNRGGLLTINNGTFNFSDESLGGEYITNTGNLYIKNGTFNADAHEYRINIPPQLINNSGSANIQGGTFNFDFENGVLKEGSTTEYRKTDDFSPIGTPEKPYYGDPGALIRNTGTLMISDGTFKGKGTLLNQVGTSAHTGISGGNFEANYMISSHGYPQAKISTSTLSITNGVFHTAKTFYLYDDKDNLPQEQSIEDGSGTWGLYRDNNGDARGGMCTGPYCSTPWVFGTFANQKVKGGDYSDGENIEPDSGFAKVYLDSDYDGDGKKDARIVPKAGPVSDHVEIGETKELQYYVKDGSSRASFPENTRIMEQTNTEYCSGKIINNKLYVTGHKYTEGTSSLFCHITVTDDSSYVLEYSINVNPDNEYDRTTGEPISLTEGESATPEDFDGDPEDYEWVVSSGETYCKVENGVITAIKGGGSCIVVAHEVPEDGSTDKPKAITWVVTTTTPLEIGVGESKKPDDLPAGAENGEWSSSDETICTVASDGTITGKKAGTCYVTLKLEDGTIYTWKVTINDNPDTLDVNRASLFTAAGIAIGGMTAIFATVRRFFGRK